MVRLKALQMWFHEIVMIFQFLMVRLKVRRACLQKTGWRISIPYGSIKSWGIGEFKNWKTWVFQFLMVRLKAYRILMHCVVTAFQFLMVRLKASVAVADG